MLPSEGVQRCRDVAVCDDDLNLNNKTSKCSGLAFGSSWKLDGKSGHEPEPAAPTLDITKGREKHVTKRMVWDVGPTPGCPRCNPGEGTHTDACRPSTEGDGGTARRLLFANQTTERPGRPEWPRKKAVHGADGDTCVLSDALNTGCVLLSFPTRNTSRNDATLITCSSDGSSAHSEGSIPC